MGMVATAAAGLYKQKSVQMRMRSLCHKHKLWQNCGAATKRLCALPLHTIGNRILVAPSAVCWVLLSWNWYPFTPRSTPWESHPGCTQCSLLGIAELELVPIHTKKHTL